MTIVEFISKIELALHLFLLVFLQKQRILSKVLMFNEFEFKKLFFKNRHLEF